MRKETEQTETKEREMKKATVEREIKKAGLEDRIKTSTGPNPTTWYRLDLRNGNSLMWAVFDGYDTASALSVEGKHSHNISNLKLLRQVLAKAN